MDRLHARVLPRLRNSAVVDTSANYTGGASEKLVGKGILRWRDSAEGNSTNLKVISKFGYASVSISHGCLAHVVDYDM